MSQDVFQRNIPNIKGPLTADHAIIDWGGVLTSAIQVSIQYAQPVNRRRTIGNRDAIIHTGLGAGQISIGRIVTETDAKQLFNTPGWNGCQPGTITITLPGGCGAAVSGEQVNINPGA